MGGSGTSGGGGWGGAAAAGADGRKTSAGRGGETADAQEMARLRKHTESLERWDCVPTTDKIILYPKQDKTRVASPKLKIKSKTKQNKTHRNF